MVIFHSYVSLPEGIFLVGWENKTIVSCSDFLGIRYISARSSRRDIAGMIGSGLGKVSPNGLISFGNYPVFQLVSPIDNQWLVILQNIG